MTTIAIQSLAAGEADQYAFVDEEYLSAAGKQQILADWQRFITSGFKKLFFSRDLYRFLHHNCDFIAHTNQETFWAYYFNSEVNRLRAFLNQFGGNGHSAEYGTRAWFNGPAADLKQAMCQEMVRLYPPLLQVLQDLELKHAELGRVWREFALNSRVPDPGYPRITWSVKTPATCWPMPLTSPYTNRSPCRGCSGSFPCCLPRRKRASMSPGPPEGGPILVQKKTQIASADHRLIMAWVRGEREDLSLTTREVLDRYTPPDIKGSAQYFTGLETGLAALERLRTCGCRPPVRNSGFWSRAPASAT
ncbi:MAG: hypothetical protein HS126_37725 [Anaerolineales bacterium]|nr:hypothetical protein [Anaerolineales bacterium]